MAKWLVVGISDQKIAFSPDKLVSYALGSCVGVCIYDRKLRVAGLAHILLPNSKESLHCPVNPCKYADTAIEKLVAGMEAAGCRRQRLTAKISGGANMFDIPGPSIGEKNVEAVKLKLLSLKIDIVAADVGGNHGRTLIFDSVSGKLEIKSLFHGNKII
ncbi:MAG TPA: chemotaxis protein CheD [Candidatus Avimonas sp.]|jgi:chemotaxis protein CheD|nr:chemotaxis protein CheD [Clostridiales bacterium]HOB37201.1 chemotaxis protein CheD [Candidatus Avimonas sp.]HQA15552.1 chemotaxis protein CheD [Candidatus Avimonas sp.]HQD37582.1 chemotaxis protein CheD [Candidatus Avimonas sp.]